MKPKFETSDKTLRNFSIGAMIFFALLSAFFFYKSKINIFYITSALSIFFILPSIFPQISKPIYLLWMNFAHYLGIVNTKIILSVVFILTVVPVSLILILFRKDILDKKLDKSADSYWNQREKKEMNPKSYERHF